MAVETIESLQRKSNIEGNSVTFSGDPQDFSRWCSLVLEKSRKRPVGIICSYSKVNGELITPEEIVQALGGNK